MQDAGPACPIAEKRHLPAREQNCFPEAAENRPENERLFSPRALEWRAASVMFGNIADARGAAERGPGGGHRLLVTLTVFGVLTRTDETLRLSNNSMG